MNDHTGELVFVKPLQWAPGESSGYESIQATTPFGLLRISWKSWKKSPSFDLEESPWGEKILLADTIDEAKAEVQAEYTRVVISSLESKEMRDQRAREEAKIREQEFLRLSPPLCKACGAKALNNLRELCEVHLAEFDAWRAKNAA